MLEEGLQGLADCVPLLDGQQVLQLLAEGPPVDFDAGWKNLCHPLQRTEGWRPAQQAQWKLSLFFIFKLKKMQCHLTVGSDVSLFVPADHELLEMSNPNVGFVGVY